MKKTLTIAALLLAVFFCRAQNVSINILTQNSGQVAVGSIVALEVTICNTDAAVSVPSYKLRPRISVPSIVTIPATGHTLPSGWNITANTGTQITLTNGTDQVAAGECRTILIMMQGVSVGGPTTVNSNLLFSNGVAPGTATGTATPGDASADNTSTSTVQVVPSVPLTLLQFTATSVDCHTSLNWTTTRETGTSYFDVERASSNNQAVWVKTAHITATGNNGNTTTYNSSDIPGSGPGKWLYRLKMVDRNGEFAYSPIVPVAAKCNEASVIVYPNPVSGGKFFITASGLGKNATATLKSAEGRIVYTGKVVNGINQISTQRVTAGYYLLSVQDEEGATIQYKVIFR